MYNVIFSGNMLTGADLSGAAFSGLEHNAPRFAGAGLPKALDALGQEMRAMLIAHDVWIRSAGRQGKRADLSRRDASGQSLSGVNLSAASMEFVVLVGCDLSRMDLLMGEIGRASCRERGCQYV